jgi:phospholipid/cholesterol/gamma-HCH transport system ATP-binding protein
MGVTAITITHDMTSARTIADQVAMLHAGKIRWQGHVAQMDDASDPYLTQFITGAPEGPIETLR